MDIHNLATLFGPNLLHKAKGGMEYEVETLERADERKDVIKILEELIKNHQQIFTVSWKGQLVSPPPPLPPDSSLRMVTILRIFHE